MVFSSIIFLFYFLPVFFLIYYLADKKYKNVLILIGSIIFYAWGAPHFIFVILGTTVIDFYIVRLMSATNVALRRKLLLCTSLSVNLGLLFYFKYCNFFADNLNDVFLHLKMKPMMWTSIILPLGLSFFTFSTITYIVDVYKNIQKPARSILDYLLYILLFPKLIAGPIIPYHDFADQIHGHVELETIDNRLRGIFRFCIGLGKKVLIANVLGTYADAIFAMPVATMDAVTAWCGAISFALQIYFDFSGYTDMGIALGMMMGFRLPENFNTPYAANSMTDFWKRWHMSFIQWVRNYLFIPLCGTHTKKSRLYLSLCVAVLFITIWHGIAWTFIAWAVFHCIFLVIEHLFLTKWLTKIGRTSFIYTFVVIVIGWIFFRSPHVEDALHYIQQMFSWSTKFDSWHTDREFVITSVIALFFSFFTLTRIGEKIERIVFTGQLSIVWQYALALVLITMFIISIGRIAYTPFNDFIYSRF